VRLRPAAQDRCFRRSWWVLTTRERVLGAVLRHTTVNISFAGILLLFLLLGRFVGLVAGLTYDDSQLTSGVASHSDEQLPLPKVELAQEDAFAGRKCLYGESPETSKLRRCKLSLRI